MIHVPQTLGVVLFHFLSVPIVLGTNISMYSLLLREWAFLTSHNAATGYMAGSHPLASIARTQTTDLGGQLDCGVRAFDLRPAINASGSVVMAHGLVVISTLLSTALQDVIRWASKNPSELIILYVNSCSIFTTGGDIKSVSCLQSTFTDIFSAAGMPIISDCAVINTLTVKNAMQTSVSPGNGHVLAISGCVQENYVPAITCYSPATRAPCYGAGGNSAAMPALEAYINATAAAAAAAGSSGLWMLQVWRDTSPGCLRLGLFVDSDMQNSSPNKDADGGGGRGGGGKHKVGKALGRRFSEVITHLI
jgi:hypothetical protein